MPIGTTRELGNPYVISRTGIRSEGISNCSYWKMTLLLFLMMIIILYLIQHAKHLSALNLIVTQKSLAVTLPKYHLLFLIETGLIFLKALYYSLLKKIECVNIKIHWYLIIMNHIPASNIKQNILRICNHLHTWDIFGLG